MNVFIRAIVRRISFGERLIVPFNEAIAELNATINLSPHENILTIALMRGQVISVLLFKGRYRILPRVSAVNEVQNMIS